jgi:uncharacterized protein (DUF362 family)
MSVVVIADASRGVGSALEEIFHPFGGIRATIGTDTDTVYIKPNGVHFSPYSHTDPAVLEAVLAYLHDHGYKRLAVMESATAGNFSRLVFKVTGYARICRHYGAEPVYLDEGPTVTVELRDASRVRIARRLHDHVVNRGQNFYLSLPKLKTHSMTKVTLGVKNQQAFPLDEDRMNHHNHRTLPRRLAALYALTQPDFCIIEGLHATAHGHFPATSLLDESLVPMHLLIGGADTLATDVVGARVLGYGLEEVEYLRLCAESGLGEASLDRIDVRGIPLRCFTRRLPHTLLRRIHPSVRWVIGREKACTEGCRGNSECIQELLYNDYRGEGGWTLVCGSGFVQTDFDNLLGDILVIGPCACDETVDILRQHYPERKIYQVPAHNDLMANTRYQARLMGIKPIQMVPLNPIASAVTLLQARLRGLTARVPPLLG